MKLLVDANNALMGGSHFLPSEHAGVSVRGLCRLLHRYCRGRVVVVADGSPKPGDLPSIDIGGVELIWSGAKQKADPIILELIDEEPDPRNLRLISTDRQLQVAARRRGAQLMDAEEFMRELGREMRRQRAAAAQPSRPVDMLDTPTWLREFGLSEGGEGPGDIEDEVTRYMKEFGLEPEE